MFESFFNQFQSYFYGPSTLYGTFNQLVDATPENDQCSFELAKMIYQNQNPADMNEQIAKCPDLLSRQFKPYYLSAFHLAVMSDNEAAMEALHANGAKINLLDFQDYTPLHHAAMKGNTTAVSKLLAWGASPKAVNAYGGTYADLLRFNLLSNEDKNQNFDKTLFSAHKNENYQIDETCWQPDVKFVQEMVAQPQKLMEMWRTPPSAENQDFAYQIFFQDLMKSYHKFIQDPATLSIQKINLPNGNKMCGIFAMRDIKKGEIIAEYVGEASDSYIDNGNDFTLEGSIYSINAQHYRSAASMANCGFPNAYLINLFQPVAGLPDRSVLVALTDIAKENQITTYYGSFYNFHENEFVEQNPKAQDDFLKKYPWKKLDQSIEEALVSDPLTAVSLTLGGEYLLVAPGMLAELAKQKKIKRSDLAAIKSFSENHLSAEALLIAKKSIAEAAEILKMQLRNEL